MSEKKDHRLLFEISPTAPAANTSQATAINPLGRLPKAAGDFGNVAAGSVASAAVKYLCEVPAVEIVAKLKSTIAAVQEAFTLGPGGPESCEIKFGMKITAEGNVYVANIGSEVSMEVKLIYKRPAIVGNASS